MFYKKLKRCRAIWLLLAVFIIPAMSSIAQAQTPVPLKWFEVETPGIQGNIIVTPSEVSKIAVGSGDIIYAIDSENGMVYRSDNGGQTSDNITQGLLNAGAVLPASEIAVAP